MKKKIFTLTTTILFVSTLWAQNVSLTPTDDCYVWSAGPTDQNGTNKELAAARWTWGAEGTIRSYIKFDLSGIPSNARITSAKVVLKAPAITSAVQGGHQGINDWRVENVLSTWNENTINWNNKPATDANFAFYMPPTINKSQDYNIDITPMAMEWHSNPSDNHGLMMRLETEQKFRSLIFASKESPDVSLRPKLEVNYYVPSSTDSSIVARLDNNNSSDSYVWSVDAVSNNGTNKEIGAAQWSWGSEGTMRSLIKFDLSGIPSGAQIKHAYIRLYGSYPPSSAVQGGHQGENEWMIQRITEDWNETSVNWNNQPTITTANEINLEKSVSLNQAYCINIKALIEDILADGNNYGLMMKLADESVFRSIVFASSENVNDKLRPMIEIYYEPAIVNSKPAVKKPNYAIYPNPGKGLINLRFDNGSSFNEATVFDMTGKIVGSYILSGLDNQLNLTHLSTGIYNILLKESNGNSSMARISIHR